MQVSKDFKFVDRSRATLDTSSTYKSLLGATSRVVAKQVSIQSCVLKSDFGYFVCWFSSIAIERYPAEVIILFSISRRIPTRVSKFLGSRRNKHAIPLILHFAMRAFILLEIFQGLLVCAAALPTAPHVSLYTFHFEFD